MALALSDIRLTTFSSSLNIIFCLDRSLSMGTTQTEPLTDALNKTLGRLKETDRAGIVVFGKDPLVELELDSPRPVGDIQTLVDRDRTDLEKALLAAIGRFPLARDNRIVLMTDGNQNAGNGIDAAVLARSLGIEIWPVRSGSRAGGNEVYIEALHTPELIPLHTPFKIRSTITSTRPASGELIISRDHRIIARHPVDLLPGKNQFVFEDSIITPGLFVYKAVVNTPEDRVNENNEFISFTRSKTPSLVLYVSSGGRSHFSEALQIQGGEVNRILPSQFPNSLNPLMGVQAIVLDNVPATAFSQAQMENMETFVREAGGGLIMIGGEKSYGPGLYLDTPVERALPVFMDHPTTLEKPEFCLVLLIDKSASMAGEIATSSKLEGAKIAAFSTVEMLNPFDRIGLLAFDVEYQWVFPIGPAGNREPIARELSKLTALGGTNLFPALSHAFETLKGVRARMKHIIILSDGKTEEADFKGLVAQMAREKITISTVALGTGADRMLMKKIAAWGNGRTYYTRDTDKIPRIFAGDTKIAAHQTILEENLPVVLKDQADVISGIPVHTLPKVQGMVITHAKPSASVIFTTPRGPLLASRQYGLGRSMAFTSTFSGKWGEDWVNWPHFEKLASQMIKWVQKRSPHSLYKETITRTGDRCEFIVDLVDARGRYVNHADLTLSLLFPSKSGQDLKLNQIAPGRYQGAFNTRGPGEYYLTLHGSHKDLALHNETFFLGIPYSPEYTAKGENRALLEDMASLTHGKVIELDQMATRLPLAEKKTPGDGIPLWPYFVSFFAILFLVDVAFCKVMALKQSRPRL